MMRGSVVYVTSDTEFVTENETDFVFHANTQFDVLTAFLDDAFDDFNMLTDVFVFDDLYDSDCWRMMLRWLKKYELGENPS